MDFNKRPIEEIIEAVENHAEDIKIGIERTRIRRKVPSLKEALYAPKVDLKIMEKAYDMMQTMKALAKVKFEDYPNMEKFYEAISGVSWEQGKDDLDFCDQYVLRNKVDTESKRLYGLAWRGYGTMKGMYLLHQLREEWEGDESE